MPTRQHSLSLASILSCSVLSLSLLAGCGGAEAPEKPDEVSQPDVAQDSAASAEDVVSAEEVAQSDDKPAAETPAEESPTEAKPDPRYSQEAFLLAAENGKLRVVEICLEDQLDVNGADANGFTPLARAAYNGHEAIVKLLIKNNATVDSKDRIGMTPLIHAASCPAPSAPKTVKVLLDAGADIEAAGGREQWTALMMAAAEGNLDVVKLLVEEGAKKETVDADGDTAASFATENGHTEVVKFLSGE